MTKGLEYYVAETHIRDLNLSVRTYNVLILHQISTIGQLVACSPSFLLGLRYFGPTSLSEVSAQLARFNAHLATDQSDHDTEPIRGYGLEVIFGNNKRAIGDFGRHGIQSLYDLEQFSVEDLCRLRVSPDRIVDVGNALPKFGIALRGRLLSSPPLVWSEVKEICREVSTRA